MKGRYGWRRVEVAGEQKTSRRLLYTAAWADRHRQVVTFAHFCEIWIWWRHTWTLSVLQALAPAFYSGENIPDLKWIHSFQWYKLEKCVGLSTDRARAMVGKLSGTVKRMAGYSTSLHYPPGSSGHAYGSNDCFGWSSEEGKFHQNVAAGTLICHMMRRDGEQSPAASSCTLK